LRRPRHHRNRCGDGRRWPPYHRCGIRRQCGLASSRRRGGCGIRRGRTRCDAWSCRGVRRRSGGRRWGRRRLPGARGRRRRPLVLLLRGGGRRWRRRCGRRGRMRWGRRGRRSWALRRRRGWGGRMWWRRRRRGTCRRGSLRGFLGRLLGFPVRPHFLPLCHHDRRRLRVRWGGHQLHGRQRGRGKQRYSQVCHVLWVPGKF
jgi:hypothetical protein